MSFEELCNTDHVLEFHKPMFCSLHPNENLAYFCYSCQVGYYYSTVLWPLDRTTCVSWHPQLSTGGIDGTKVYCPHALAYSYWPIWIREKMLVHLSGVTYPVFVPSLRRTVAYFH